VAIGAGSASESKAVIAQRFVERVRELNRTVGIPEKVAVLRAEDIPAIASAARIEAATDYPVPKNMNQRDAEALLRDCLQ
jgi:alcohol dehydrogenase class IV